MFSISMEMHQIPQEHMLMRMEQLASNHIRIPNEWSSVLISTRPQATTAHSPRVYNQHIQLSRPELQQRQAESLFPELIRHLNSQFKKEEVFFFGLEDVHQLENIGMLHPEEMCHKAQDKERNRERERCQESYRR